MLRSFIFFVFASSRERQLIGSAAQEEAEYALEKHGPNAHRVLLGKARMSSKLSRHATYRLAARLAKKHHRMTK